MPLIFNTFVLFPAVGFTPTTVTDDFNRASLGSNWNIVNGSWPIVNNHLNLDNPTNNTTYVLMHNTAMNAVKQAAHVRADNSFGYGGNRSIGIIFRAVSASAGPAYQFHVAPNGGLRVDRVSAAFGFVERMDDTTDTLSGYTAGDLLGFSVEGTDGSTVFKAWRNPTLNDYGNWGAADNTLTLGSPAGYVNTGNYVGIRVYSGTWGVDEEMDDFHATTFA